MRSWVIGVAVAVGCMGLGAPAAQALPSRDLYMVRDVDIWDADYSVEPPRVKQYSGWYYVLRKAGRSVVGQIGHLHYDTDNMCLAGTVSGQKYRFVAHRGKEEPYNLRGKWVGSGSAQHAKGYRSVSHAQMQAYMMGRDPRDLIHRCAKG